MQGDRVTAARLRASRIIAAAWEQDFAWGMLIWLKM